jgi:hypothetical protein
VEEAERDLVEEQQVFEKEKKLFEQVNDLNVSIAACKELTALREECDETLNSKKMDLLKIKVHAHGSRLLLE